MRRKRKEEGILMEKQTYIVTFEGVSPSDANRYAEELRNALLDATADIAVQRKRESPQTQDFGSTLILIVGTPAVGAVVTAVSNWLQLRKNASLTWKTADGEMIVQNISSKNAVELAQQFLNKK
jgi:hypothetical protein